MPMHRDILIWLATWTLITLNIRTQETCSVQEASRMALIEHISQTVVVTLTAVHLLFVLTAAANVWVATLSLVAKKYGTKTTKL